ncbi:hypothetical protein PXW85_27340, partial [Klebsiella pneumoniae]|nr:hypothetical protein [Klebsiella pneumoniae]
VYADPTSDTHSSGATVIDIEKPNAAGVSHNLYRDFNVGTNGTLAQSSSGRIEATNAITAHSYWLNQNGYMNAADITTDHG